MSSDTRAHKGGHLVERRGGKQESDAGNGGAAQIADGRDDADQHAADARRVVEVGFGSGGEHLGVQKGFGLVYNAQLVAVVLAPLPTENQHAHRFARCA